MIPLLLHMRMRNMSPEMLIFLPILCFLPLTGAAPSLATEQLDTGVVSWHYYFYLEVGSFARWGGKKLNPVQLKVLDVQLPLLSDVALWSPHQTASASGGIFILRAAWKNWEDKSDFLSSNHCSCNGFQWINVNIFICLGGISTSLTACWHSIYIPCSDELQSGLTSSTKTPQARRR